MESRYRFQRLFMRRHALYIGNYAQSTAVQALKLLMQYAQCMPTHQQSGICTSILNFINQMLPL